MAGPARSSTTHLTVGTNTITAPSKARAVALTAKDRGSKQTISASQGILVKGGEREEKRGGRSEVTVRNVCHSLEGREDEKERRGHTYQ